MTFVEHITKSDLAEHRRRMERDLRWSRWLSRANLLAALLVVWASRFDHETLARSAIAAMTLSACVFVWISWRGMREQRQVMRLLQADVDNLRALTQAEIERRTSGEPQ